MRICVLWMAYSTGDFKEIFELAHTLLGINGPEVQTRQDSEPLSLFHVSQG